LKIYLKNKMMTEERSTSDLNVNVIQQSFMANTVLPVVNNDIETGSNNSINNSSNNELVSLKGILKKSCDMDDEIRTGKMVIKMCTTLLFIVLTTPIIVCDLYFGFSDHSCINEMPDGFNYTMKLYLLVSGFIGLSWLLFMIFNLIWNILGAVTFWGSVYKGGHCDSKTSSYIYVSLIIKIVCTLIALQKISNKKT